MKIKRYKKIQRNMGFFQKHFGFRSPYQILVDGTLANAALQNKVNMKEQFPKYLNSSVKLLTTACTVIETQEIGAVLSGALQILQRFPLHKCGHKDKSVSAARCLESMVKPDNPNRYIIATQDMGLRERLREIPGVAILYLHGNAPTLEVPSETCQAHATAKTEQKLEVVGYQKEILDQMKKANNLEESPGPRHKGTKKRKRAGPNPLSCLKPKKIGQGQKAVSGEQQKEQQRKRKRPKVRIPRHVKELQKAASS